jgi:hypothetical protein
MGISGQLILPVAMPSLYPLNADSLGAAFKFKVPQCLRRLCVRFTITVYTSRNTEHKYRSIYSYVL